MNQEIFQIFLWVMSAVALVVFIALYFVKAGYGTALITHRNI